MADNNNMEALMSRRRVLKSKLTRVEKAVALLNDQTSTATLQVQLEHVDKVEVDLLVFEEDLLEAVTDVEQGEHTEECSQMIDRCIAVKATLKGLLQPTSRNAPNQGGGAAPDGNGVKSHMGVKLPKLETPRFSGNLHEWISFRDRFTAAIHSKPECVLSGSEKLEYLKSSLEGEAAEVIRSIQVTDGNYLIAWDLLVKRYENNREISRAHLDRLMGQEAVKAECGISLRALVDRTRECMRSLEVLKVPVKTWDIIVCHIIGKKLDGGTRQQWELTFVDGSFPSLNEMLEFLERRARAMTAAGSIATIQQQNNQHDKKGKAWTSSSSCHLGTKGGCELCGEVHRVVECNKLLEAGPAERRDLILKAGLCFTCLLPGHISRRCNAGGCSLCNKRHHVLLHLDDEEMAEQVTNNHMCNSNRHHSVLLPTAVIQVEDGSGEFQPVRALLDGGSQASFIKESTVKKLNLDSTEGWVQIVGLGKTKMASTKQKVELRMKSSYDDQFFLVVTAHVLADITCYTPSGLEGLDYQHLQAIKLADPFFDQPGEIEVLLGADARGEIIRAGVMKGAQGEPYGELTAFGWIISGAVGQLHSDPLASHHAICKDPSGVLEVEDQNKVQKRKMVCDTFELEYGKRFRN